MLEEDIQNAVQKIQDENYPPGVKALAKAIQHTQGDLRRKVASYLSQYLTKRIIAPIQLVAIAQALQASAVLSRDELYAILNLKDAVHKTALALAIRSHTLSTIQALIDLGADIELRVGIYSKKPLALAVTYKRVAVVSCLLKAGARVTDEIFAFARSERAIYHAGLAVILSGYFSRAFDAHLLLIEQGTADVLQIFTWLTLCNNSFLMSACKLEAPLWRAINNNVKLRSQLDALLLPLIEAGYINIAEYLINIAKLRSNLEALLLQAMQAGHVNAAVYLISIIKRNCAETFCATNIHGKTALHLAVEKGWIQVICDLIAAGASLHAKDIEGKTALHLAAERGWYHLIKTLIVAGAPLSSEDSMGQTALYIVARLDNPSVMVLLAEHMLLQRQAMVLRDIEQLNMDEASMGARLIQERESYISQLKKVMCKYEDISFRTVLFPFISKATGAFAMYQVNVTLGRPTNGDACRSTDAPPSLSASDSGVALSRPETSIPSLSTSGSGFIFSARASVPAPSLPDSIATLQRNLGNNGN